MDKDREMSCDLMVEQIYSILTLQYCDDKHVFSLSLSLSLSLSCACVGVVWSECVVSVFDCCECEFGAAEPHT